MPDARSCRCWRRLPDYIRVAATGGGCQTTSESRGWRRLPNCIRVARLAAAAKQTTSELPRLAAAAKTIDASEAVAWPGLCRRPLWLKSMRKRLPVRPAGNCGRGSSLQLAHSTLLGRAADTCPAADPFDDCKGHEQRLGEIMNFATHDEFRPDSHEITADTPYGISSDAHPYHLRQALPVALATDRSSDRFAAELPTEAPRAVALPAGAPLTSLTASARTCGAPLPLSSSPDCC